MKPLTTFAELPDTYENLVAFHTPRPIHDDTELENTVEIVDALAGHRLTKDQEDYLHLLSQLVETYENETVERPKNVRGIETLAFLLEEHGQTGDGLATLLGVDRSVAYKILKGTRKLTADHVRKLSAHFRVSADLFLA
jgi:HTH-type transcriptional regulator / antitoxin HigA